MSGVAIFLKRFLARPSQVASIMPSSRAVTKRIADRFDFTQRRVVVEFGSRWICSACASRSSIMCLRASPFR